MTLNFGQGSPGVRIQLNDNSQINLNVVSTTVGGVVGFSSRGAFNKILSLNSPAQMDTVLGNGFNNPAFNQGLYAGKAVLRNGGFLEFVRPFNEINTALEDDLKSDTFVVNYKYNTSTPLEQDKVRNSFKIEHFATTRYSTDGYSNLLLGNYGHRKVLKIQEALVENTNIDFSLNKVANTLPSGVKTVALFSIINEDPTAADRATSDDDTNSDSLVITTASYKTAHSVTDNLTVFAQPVASNTLDVMKHNGSVETFTFVTATPGLNQILIGGSEAETALNIKNKLANHPNLINEIRFIVTGNIVTAYSYFGINDTYDTTFSKVFSSTTLLTSVTFQPSVEDNYVLLSSGLGRNFLNLGIAIEAYVKDKYDDANFTRHFELTSVGKDVAEMYMIVDYTFDGKVFSFQGTITPFVLGDINLFIGNAADNISNGFKFVINENEDLLSSIDDTNFNFAQSVYEFEVDCATTADINLSYNPMTLVGNAPDVVDTVILTGLTFSTQATRILVKNQTNPTENGIYVVKVVGTGSDGVWVRTTDSNNVTELENGSHVFVKGGTLANTTYKLVSADPLIVGTSAITFNPLGMVNTPPLHTAFSKVAFDLDDPAIDSLHFPTTTGIWTYDPRKNRNSNTLANAWELFLDKDQSDADMLVAAGTDVSNLFVKNSEELDLTVVDAMLEVCEKRKDMFCLLDGLDEPNIENALRKMGGVGSQGDKARWGAIFDGRSIFFDRTYTKLNVEVVKSIEMAGIIANNRRGGLFWLPPAGKDFGTIPGALASKQKYIRKYNFSEDPNSDIARLYDANINPTRVTDAGMIIYGQKTMLKRSTALNRLNVIMLVAGLHKKFEKFLDEKVFQGNTSALRASISASLNADLDKIKAANPPGLTAGLIICNDTNNPPDVIDANQMFVDMLLQPTRAAEFITLRTTVQRTGDQLTITSVNIIG